MQFFGGLRPPTPWLCQSIGPIFFLFLWPYVRHQQFDSYIETCHSGGTPASPFQKCNADCTLLPSAFGESLGWELLETRLGQCDSLHSCRELSVSAADTRRQPGETQFPLTRAHIPLKKRDLNEVRHERQGYTRGSKARRVFPSTLSLSPCLGFPRWESTAGIRNPY